MKQLSSPVVTLLLTLMLLSGFNFFNQLKFFSIPIFQLTLVFTITYLIIVNSKYSFPKLKAIQYTKYYIYASLIPLVIGFSYNNIAFITYLYGLFPLLLFLLTYKQIDYTFYEKLLSTMNISMFIVTALGWLIRIGFLDYNFFYIDVIESEFNLGYWGLRYTESTRNADYLYPLVGLSISMYFYVKNKKPLTLSLILLYIITLIASQSRAAFIISIVALVLIYVYSKKKQKVFFIFLSILLVIINFDIIYNLYITEYHSIINSIFSLDSSESRFSNTSRLRILNNAFTASIFNPFGYGIDNYHQIYYIFDFGKRISYSAENAFITLLVERGWLPLFLFIASFFSMLKFSFSSKTVMVNKFLLPSLLIYFLFNYELNNVFANFIFFLIFIDHYLNVKRKTNV